MHTFVSKNGDCRIHFNSDFSGKAIIQNDKQMSKVSVPAKFLLEFVVEEYIKVEKISEIESADYKEILSGFVKGGE